MLLPFGLSNDWPPIFYSVLNLSIGSGGVAYPVIHVWFDGALMKAARDKAGLKATVTPKAKNRVVTSEPSQ